MPRMPMEIFRRTGQSPLRPCREPFLIPLREFGAPPDETVERRELVQTERGLNVHHIVLVARRDDLVMLRSALAKTIPGLAVHAVKTQQGNFFGQAVITRDNTTAFARSDVLVRVKTEHLRVAECTDTLAFVFRADGMRRIFDHAQPVFVRQRVERIEVHRKSREMHRHNRARTLGDRLCQS